MKWAKGAALFVIIAMSICMTNILLNDSMYHGVGNDNFNAGFKDPWQTFIHMDLMTGLVMFCTWLAYREKDSPNIDTVIWIWMILWWGNIVVAFYLLIAAYQANGNASVFFSGQRSGEPLRTIWAQPNVIARSVCILLALGSTVWLYRALQLVNFAGTPAFGLYAGFLPVAATFLLLAFPRGNTGKAVITR